MFSNLIVKFTTATSACQDELIGNNNKNTEDDANNTEDSSY